MCASFSRVSWFMLEAELGIIQDDAGVVIFHKRLGLSWLVALVRYLSYHIHRLCNLHVCVKVLAGVSWFMLEAEFGIVQGDAGVVVFYKILLAGCPVAGCPKAECPRAECLSVVECVV